MTVRLSVVQPRTAFGVDAEPRNLATAERLVAEAARAGADLVCLPENFPGSWRAPVRTTPVEALGRMARRYEVHLVGGFAEPVGADGDRCYNSLTLIGPDGDELGRYRRTTPSQTPWLYRGGDHWDYDWVNAVDLPVFDTALGPIGLLICSEVFAPELARILAVKGAEIILMPAGIVSPDPAGTGPTGDLDDAWRVLIQARAIENLAFTAVCSNLVEAGIPGRSMICGPEGILGEHRGEGVLTRDLDLERIRWLRDQQDRTVPEGAGWRAKPGNLRDWRRTEVLAANPELSAGSPAVTSPSSA